MKVHHFQTFAFKYHPASPYAEDVLPYERPALSKGFLHKEGPPRLPGFNTSVGGGGERQTDEWYAKNGVEVILATCVTGADLATKTLTTDKVRAKVQV